MKTIVKDLQDYLNTPDTLESVIRNASLEKTEYKVVCLDRNRRYLIRHYVPEDRYDLVRDTVGSVKEGRARAKQLLLDPENTKEGYKIEILDGNGDCVADYFFPE
jgi:hypothetical protein